MKRALVVFSGLWITLLLVGCLEGGGPSQHLVLIDTVGSLVRVQNDGPGMWTDQTAWRLDSTGVEIGTVEGEEEYLFGSVTAVAVGARGRVYVADGQVPEVRVFTAEGVFEFRIGGDGEGPGEFRAIDAIRVGEDGTVAVRDPRLSRVSLFGPNGTFLSSFRLDRPYMIFNSRLSFWIDRGGQVHDQTSLGVSPEVDRIGVVTYDPAGEQVRTTVVAEYSVQSIVISRDGVPRMSFPVPYSPIPSVAVSAQGRILTGFGSPYEIALLGEAGDTARLISRVVAPEPLPSWAEDSTRALVAQMREMAGGGDVSSYSLPQLQPAFTLLLVDDLGYVWVGREGDRRKPPAQYDIFDPEGQFLGSIETPRVLIFQVGSDFVAVRREGEFGVPSVVLLGLDRGRTF